MLSSGHGCCPHELTAVVAQQELHKMPYETMHTSLCVCMCMCMCTLVWKCTNTHVHTRPGGRRQRRNLTATVHFIYQDGLSLNLELIN